MLIDIMDARQMLPSAPTTATEMVSLYTSRSTLVVDFSAARLFCMRFDAGPSSTTLETLHTARRAAFISGERLL